MRHGRWGSGDIAERKHDEKLFRVIGFITQPAVVFRAIDGDEEMVEVAGCLNEVHGLRHYGREEDDND